MPRFQDLLAQLAAEYGKLEAENAQLACEAFSPGARRLSDATRESGCDDPRVLDESLGRPKASDRKLIRHGASRPRTAHAPSAPRPELMRQVLPPAEKAREVECSHKLSCGEPAPPPPRRASRPPSRRSVRAALGLNHAGTVATSAGWSHAGSHRGSLTQGPGRVSNRTNKLHAQFDRLDPSGEGFITASECMGMLSLVDCFPGIERCERALKGLEELVADFSEQGSVVSGSEGADTFKPQSHTAEPRLDFAAFCFLMERRCLDSLGAEDCGLLHHLREAFHREAQSHFEDMTRVALAERLPQKSKDSDISLTILDAVSGFVVLLNSLAIGIRADWATGSKFWIVLEAFFAVFFISEAALKMSKFGLRKYFWGEDWRWNNLDCFVAFTAVVEMCLTVMHEADESMPHYNLLILKIFRWGRLARLTRLIRYKIFRELRMMINGVVAGLRVLLWSTVLLAVIIYLLGTLMRIVVGEDSGHYTSQLSFQTVPWSMFTLFRCFTDGGCAAYDGTPLHVHLVERYGAPYMIGYMLTYFFVTIGVFNLVMAIFIENVMESSVQRKQKELGANSSVMEIRLKEQIAKLCLSDTFKMTVVKSQPRPRASRLFLGEPANSQDTQQRKSQADMAIENLIDDEVSITRDVFNLWLQDPTFLGLLEELDIGAANKATLFDVLDCDLSGELGVDELISGLMKLRGPNEKSDVVAALLSIRHMVGVLEEVRTKVCGPGE